MQCSCMGITWHLCLLSKLNIMTPVSSGVSSHHSMVSCSWFAQILQNTATDSGEEKQQESFSTSHTWAVFFFFLHFKVVELLVPSHLYVICDYLSRRQLWLYRRLAGRKYTPWTSTPIRAWGRGRPTTLTTNLCGPLGDRWARAGDKIMNDRREWGEGGRKGGWLQVFTLCLRTFIIMSPHWHPVAQW